MTPSDNLLRRLSRVSPTVAFLVTLAALLAGLMLPGIVGALLLFALGVALASLTFATWPVQKPATRVVRIFMLVLLFSAVVAKIV